MMLYVATSSHRTRIQILTRCQSAVRADAALPLITSSPLHKSPSLFASLSFASPIPSRLCLHPVEYFSQPRPSHRSKLAASQRLTTSFATVNTFMLGTALCFWTKISLTNHNLLRPRHSLTELERCTLRLLSSALFRITALQYQHSHH